MTTRILFVVLLYASPAFATDVPPDWVRRRPEGANHDYFPNVGEGASESEAYTAAVLRALAEVGRETAGLQVSAEMLISAQAQISHRDGQSFETESIREHLHSSGSWQIAPGVKIVRVELGRDASSGRYRAYVLVEVPRREPRAVSLPVDALWRSALVPGWGQISKRQEGKGYAILATEAVLLAGTLTTGIMNRKARADANATAIPADRTFYSDRADNLFYASLGIGIAAAAVYVYNLLDAYLAERSDIIYQTAHPTPVMGLSSSQAQPGLRLTF